MFMITLRLLVQINTNAEVYKSFHLLKDAHVLDLARLVYSL